MADSTGARGSSKPCECRGTGASVFCLHHGSHYPRCHTVWAHVLHKLRTTDDAPMLHLQRTGERESQAVLPLEPGPYHPICFPIGPLLRRDWGARTVPARPVLDPDRVHRPRRCVPGGALHSYTTARIGHFRPVFRTAPFLDWMVSV